MLIRRDKVMIKWKHLDTHGHARKNGVMLCGVLSTWYLPCVVAHLACTSLTYVEGELCPHNVGESAFRRCEFTYTHHSYSFFDTEQLISCTPGPSHRSYDRVSARRRFMKTDQRIFAFPRPPLRGGFASSETSAYEQLFPSGLIMYWGIFKPRPR